VCRFLNSPPVPPYPIFLGLSGVPVLVVGGGAVAARKVGDLVASGAQVTLVAPEFDGKLLTLARRRGSTVKLIKRAFRMSDVKAQRLVIAATNDAGLNERISAAARKNGLLVNCAAPPEAGNFAVPAAVRRGNFCIAISTSGASAALAAHWRQRLEKIVGVEWGTLARLLVKMRDRAKSRIADPASRRALLRKLGKPHWAAKIKKLGAKEVERRMSALFEAARCTA